MHLPLFALYGRGAGLFRIFDAPCLRAEQSLQDVMRPSAYSAAVKLNNPVTTSFTTIGNGMSDYTAQKIRAANPGRVKKGYLGGLKMVWLLSAPLSGLYLVCGDGIWLAWPIGWGLGMMLSGMFVLTVLQKIADTRAPAILARWLLEIFQILD